jgi:hypothetical protein
MKKTIHLSTNDRAIRLVVKAKLQEDLNREIAHCPHVKIIEELGITHGAARVDIAVVNGVIHGYELKSDLDTLERLPWQVKIYNLVLDRMTLVVGKSHLSQAIELVPDWWGITVAKTSGSNQEVSLYEIREARENCFQDNFSIAALLWREEALTILEEFGEAKGVRSKSRRAVYERLVTVLDQTTLRARVRKQLCVRTDWRSDLQYSLNDG